MYNHVHVFPPYLKFTHFEKWLLHNRLKEYHQLFPELGAFRFAMFILPRYFILGIDQ